MTTGTFDLADGLVRERTASDPLEGRGWRVYLALAALLIPVILPQGPAQVALLDLVNLGAMVAFAAAIALRRVPVVLPFALPAVLVAIGSLLAVSNAESVGASALTLAQDLYLYAWFVLLVAVMSRQGDLRGFRIAWSGAAVAVALLCLVQGALANGFPGGLLSAKGFRPAATFANPNLCADYLVLSVFVAASLAGRVRAAVLVPAIGILLLGVLATKSNGSLLSLVVGAAAAGAVWILRADGAVLQRAGLLSLLLASLVLGGWIRSEWNRGPATGRPRGDVSVLDRTDKSSASRLEIWGQLARKVRTQPLGIGPGNSALQTVQIGHRVRPDGSFLAKEAHSDYVGYAVERGPIALVGLLLGTVLSLRLVLGARPRANEAGGGTGERAARRRLDVLRAAFVGGLVATAVHSAVIEKLHFRHTWLFLALACAATAGERFRGPAAGTPPAWARPAREVTP